MNNVQENIRYIITKNTKKIEELVTPGTFVLNKEVEKLVHENTLLRENCKHEFVNGVCKWCDLPEELN